MTTQNLNLEYLLAVFRACVTANEQGSYAVVPSENPEVKQLVKQNYIKINKRLHNADGNVAAVLVDGANEADLRVDFEIPDFPAEEQAPAAPVAPVEASVAPAAPFEAQQAAPFHTPEAAVQEVQQAPQFEPAVQQEFVGMVDQQIPEAPVTPPANDQLPEVTAPKVEEEGRILIGVDEFDVVATAQTRKGEVEIDVGVPFVIKVPKTTRAKKGEGSGLEHHPFKQIAEYKMANPSTAPSFHVPGKEVKDMSSQVKRANAAQEKENSVVTFRAQAADATDPKGPGVRVYALFVSEAPEQRKSSKKATEETKAE